MKYYYNFNLYSFKEHFEEIAKNSGISQTKEFMQHGTTTRYLHSIAVAYYSYSLAVLLGRQDHLKELVRGALAHDYFLYNSKIPGPYRRGHGANHPQIALENAEKEFSLTEMERDIIAKHMFPLTIKPPKYMESVIVSIVDKGCAVYEFFKRKNPYKLLQNGVLKNKFEEISELESMFMPIPISIK